MSVLACRVDFPILQTTMNGKRLAFLDTAASAQKPRAVTEAMTRVSETGYSNIHRGLYSISQKLTNDFEAVRAQVARFIGASRAEEIIFTRNTTEAINLVAHSWGGAFLRPGDEIVLTQMEHHANIVPWQILNGNKDLKINFTRVQDDGSLDLDHLQSLLSPATKLVAFTHISNALGTINNTKKIKEIIKNYSPEIKILIDGSQAVVHSVVNMQELDCDFYVFTGHKLYGPTGIGILFGKYDVLESMPPYQGGGDMIETVTEAGSTFKPPPGRFEAGTPAILEVIGLGAAIEYVTKIGMNNIQAHEQTFLGYATEQLQKIDGLKITARLLKRPGSSVFV